MIVDGTRASSTEELCLGENFQLSGEGLQLGKPPGRPPRSPPITSRPESAGVVNFDRRAGFVINRGRRSSLAILC